MIPTGYPRPKRIQNIQTIQRGKQSKPRMIEQKFQGKMQSFTIYRLPIDAPKYRLENGRTQAMQEEYLATHSERPANFFSGDLESDQAQKVQHELLKQVVADEGLFAHFKKNEQTEPLILTHDGFVVNGNRRLCAMRELFFGDRKRYGRFEYIDVIVLPECPSKDIDALEADLQIKRDIKAEYTWITKACMLRKKRDLGYTDAELTKMYAVDKKDIQEAITLLADADSYLASIRKPKQYHLIEGDEFAFKKLREGRTKIPDEAQKSIFTNLAYGLIDKKDAVPDRLYKVIPQMREHLSLVVEKIRKDLNIKESKKAESNGGKLKLLGGADVELKPVVDAVTKLENRDALVSIVRDVIESQRERSKEQIKSDALIEFVRRAHALLNDGINTFNSKSKLDGVKEQLDGIEVALKKLRSLIK